jgi:hypothetical protein
VDGFEHRVGASANKPTEQTCYSPKKKQHSFTTLIYTAVDGRICHVSESYAGSTSDSTIAGFGQHNLSKFLEQGEWILGDSGFKGLQHLGIITPFENKENSLQIDDWNWHCKKYRITVENSIAQIRKWKIMKHDYPTNLLKLTDSLITHEILVRLVAGLVNNYSAPCRQESFFEDIIIKK